MGVAIIFGASGQDGYYLTNLLHSLNIDVVPVSRSEGFINIDISNYQQVADLIKEHKPDYVFHFAANSTTKHTVIFENNTTIVTGTLNILEAVKNYSPNCKVFISGSALQFKNNNLPIDETTPFEARDGYSASRIASVYMARYYRSLGLQIYVGYFFNHDSERRSERHLTKKIVSAAKDILIGKMQNFEVGSLETIKEYTHARDTVSAVWILVNQTDIYEAVIGSGIGYRVKDWIELCFAKVGMNWQDYVIEKDNFKADYKSLVSNPALMRSLGWEPKITLDELATLMLL
jgi:GDPmannose 4,6-dehydratase